MKTLLIDATRTKLLLDNVKILPLFHPFTAHKEVVMLEMPVIEDAAEVVFNALREVDWLGKRWQLLLVMDLSPCQGISASQVGHYTKSAKVEQWNYFLVAQLNRLLDTRVDRVITLFLDAVERRDGLIPAGELDYGRAQLDTYGFIFNDRRERFEGTHYFKSSDFHRFQDATADICTVENDEHGSNGELSSESSPEKVPPRKQQFLQILEELLEEKKTVLGDQLDNTTLYYSDIKLKRIYERFERDWGSESPEKLLEKIVVEEYSCSAILKNSGIVSMRVVLPEREYESFPKMVEIASLLLAIIDAGEEIHFGRENELSCEVELDDEQLSEGMKEYRKILCSYHSILKKSSDTQQENQTLLTGCQEFAPDGKLPLPQTAIDCSSPERWEDSFGLAQQALDTYQQTRGTDEKNYRRGIGAAWRDVNADAGSLENQHKQLLQQRAEALALMMEYPYRSYPVTGGFQDETQQHFSMVQEYFKMLPVAASWFWLIGSLAAVAITPLLILLYYFNIQMGLADLTVWYAPLVWLVLFTIPLAILFFDKRRSLNQLRNDSSELLGKITKSVQSAGENNARFLHTLCRMLLNTLNLGRVNEEIESDGRRKKRIEHLNTRLEDHLEWVKEYLGNGELSGCADTFSQNIALDNTKPFEVQSPAFVYREGSETTFEIEGSCGNKTISTSHFIAIKKMRFNREETHIICDEF